MRHVRHSCDHVLLGPCSVGTIEKQFFSNNFVSEKKNNFLSLSLLRCGPDNKRTKEKRKTIKMKEKQKFEKQKIFFKNILNLTFFLLQIFPSLNFSTIPSYFVGHFVGHFYPSFVTHSQTEKRRNGRRNRMQYI